MIQNLIDNYYLVKNWLSDQYHCFKIFPTTLFRWVPVLWRDRDWDETWFLRIVEHKLKFMEDCQRNGHHLNGAKLANKIKVIRHRLNRMITDDYCEAEHRWMDEFFGELQMLTGPSDKITGCSRLFLYRTKSFSKGKKDLEGWWIRKLQDKKNKLYQTDAEEVFGWLAKHVRELWD